MRTEAAIGVIIKLEFTSVSWRSEYETTSCGKQFTFFRGESGSPRFESCEWSVNNVKTSETNSFRAVDRRVAIEAQPINYRNFHHQS